jgi:hypothetical protein
MGFSGGSNWVDIERGRRRATPQIMEGVLLDNAGFAQAW